MSSTKYAAEFCSLLVRENYGELPSRIFVLLTRRGRQSIQSIMHYTRLSASEVRHGIIVLIQQNLVYYHFDTSTSLTHYEANLRSAYRLVRYGRIAEIVRARCGDLACQIVQCLLLLGHTSVETLLATWAKHDYSKDRPANGTDEKDPTENGVSRNVQNGHDSLLVDGEADRVLLRLLNAGFVEVVVKNVFRSPDDTFETIEKQITRAHFPGGPKGANQKKELETILHKALRDLRTESGSESWSKSKSKHIHSISSINGNGEQHKYSNGHKVGHRPEQDDVVQIDRDLVVKVNYEKCDVALRSQQLVALAALDIGDVTSQVYEECLRLLEGRIYRCQMDPRLDDVDDDADGPTVTTIALAQSLSDNVRLANGIGKAPDEQINTSELQRARKRRRVTKDTAIDPDSDVSSDQEMDTAGPIGIVRNGNIREADEASESDGQGAIAVTSKTKAPKVRFQDTASQFSSAEERLRKSEQIQKHLFLLSEHSHHLLRRCGGRGRGEWTVDFPQVVEYMKKIELDTYIRQNFGVFGHRLVQILRQNGKLDERQLTKLSLMRQKDVRTKLVEMQMSGIVDIQEVPKDANRTANRTLFLWFFDAERVPMIIMEATYKTMSRCLEELEVQRIRDKEILILANRTDVRGSEEGMMSQEQMSKLAAFREKEDRLLTQIGRLDRLICILNDF